MRKTSLYLSDEQSERLAELSRLEGRPQAQIVRDALAQYDAPPNGKRYFAVFGSVSGDGRSAADIPEEELLEGFGE